MEIKDVPMLALKEVPKEKCDAESINALVKKDGRVVGYRLTNRKILSKKEALELARDGGIKGVGIAERKGKEYLKSLPDDKEYNNLSYLESITEDIDEYFNWFIIESLEQRVIIISNKSF